MLLLILQNKTNESHLYSQMILQLCIPLPSACHFLSFSGCWPCLALREDLCGLYTWNKYLDQDVFKHGVCKLISTQIIIVMQIKMLMTQTCTHEIHPLTMLRSFTMKFYRLSLTYTMSFRSSFVSGDGLMRT